MIKTKRLIIKALANDADGQVAALLSDEGLCQAAHLTFSTQPVAAFEVQLLLHSLPFYGLYLLDQPSRLCGLIMLDDQPGPDLPAGLELGYLLDRAYWGRGLMTEAVAGLLPALSAPVVAETDRTNYRSQRVLEKNGFRRLRSSAGHLLWQKPLASDSN